MHLIIDSTGLSIVGQAEWAAANTDDTARAAGRRLHVGVDSIRVIVAHALIEATVADATTGVDLITQVDA
jgi:hypothetical protein